MSVQMPNSLDTLQKAPFENNEPASETVEVPEAEFKDAVQAVAQGGSEEPSAPQPKRPISMIHGKNKVYLKRRRRNQVVLFGAALAIGFGLFFLACILWALAAKGVPGLFKYPIFTQITPGPIGEGGLINAIVGTLYMSFFAMLIGTPVGILAGTYLAEYGQRGWLAPVTRFINDVLLSAPSIVIGLFVYALLVVPFHHFSGWAGAVALSILVIPVVVRTTDQMLALVPNSLREAAFALGCPKWRMITFISYRAARSGMVTGVLLALARILGETAPLLFTALNSPFYSSNMSAPMSNLPIVIYQYASSPYPTWQELAWAGALLVSLFVLGLNITTRILFKSK